EPNAEGRMQTDAVLHSAFCILKRFSLPHHSFPEVFSVADTFTDMAPRQSMFDRLRAPMAFLLIALCAGGGYYYFFLQKKTEYYTSRDARLIPRAAEHRYATRANEGLMLNFEFQKEPLYGSGQVELQQLLKPVQQSIGDVFDTFFIVDSSGEVIYQPQKAPGDESGSNMKIVRL